MTECPSCEQLFKPDYPEKVYCCTPCRLEGMSKRNRSNPEAQRERGILGGRVRGAQLAAAARPGRSYKKVPGTDVHEHRAVAEVVLDRPLKHGEVVHHEDEDKRNNSIANLIVFPSQAAHARHHKLNHLGLAACDCGGIRLAEEVISNHVQ